MEASAQDEYVSDFDLEHLEEVVKREMLEQRRAEAYAQHYQNLQAAAPPPQQPPSGAQQVHAVPHPHSSASVAAAQQPAVALKHQLQVGDSCKRVCSEGTSIGNLI